MDTETLSRLELVPLICRAAVSCIDRDGAEERIDGLPGPFKMARLDSLATALRTPIGRA